MREILFKAKTIDGKRWVEGYYFAKPILNRYFIICDEAQWEVDVNTICQFTGLLDKNGNKIWENDIVDTHNRGHGYRRLEKVIYENGGFFPISTHGWECEPDADEIEVIGNIFDNADLVEG